MKPSRTHSKGSRRHRGAVSTILAGTLVVAAAVGALSQLLAHVGRASDNPVKSAVTIPKEPWRLQYVDNFSGSAGASPAGPGWSFHVGAGAGVGMYSASRAAGHLSGDGQLILTARIAAGSWQAVQLVGRRQFEAPAGGSLLVESRIKMPVGAGYWPAFWLLPVQALSDPAVEPRAGEVDVAESVNATNWVAQFLHCGVAKLRGACAEGPGARFAVDYFHRFSTVQEKKQWHTYAWLWHRQGYHSYVSFYIDNRLQLRITEHEVGWKYWNYAFNHPYVLLYDVALGGWASRPSTRSPRSASMRIDYVRVYTY